MKRTKKVREDLRAIYVPAEDAGMDGPGMVAGMDLGGMEAGGDTGDLGGELEGGGPENPQPNQGAPAA